MDYEEGMDAVEAGFTHQRNHRFILYDAHSEYIIKSGGGTALKVTYGEFIHPDLDDEHTRECYEEFNSSADLD